MPPTNTSDIDLLEQFTVLVKLALDGQGKFAIAIVAAGVIGVFYFARGQHTRYSFGAFAIAMVGICYVLTLFVLSGKQLGEVKPATAAIQQTVPPPDTLPSPSSLPAYHVLDTSPLNADDRSLIAQTNGTVSEKGQNFGVRFAIETTVELQSVEIFAVKSDIQEMSGVVRIWKDIPYRGAAQTPIVDKKVTVQNKSSFQNQRGASGTIFYAELKGISLEPGQYWISLAPFKSVNQFVMSGTNVLGDQFTQSRPNYGIDNTPAAIRVSATEANS